MSTKLVMFLLVLAFAVGAGIAIGDDGLVGSRDVPSGRVALANPLASGESPRFVAVP